jgi:hypothetical protein
MISLFSIDLELNGNRYYCLVFKTQRDGMPMFRFTIMNGDLEKEICCHNIISEKEIENPLPDRADISLASEIRTQIAKAIREHDLYRRARLKTI